MPFPVKIPQEEAKDLTNYLKSIHIAQKAFEQSITPILDPLFQEYEEYVQFLNTPDSEVNTSNPMIHTHKNEYMLYMLLIEYSNQYWKPLFDEIPLEQKVVVLPRCLTGANYDLMNVKRSKEGWHQITSCKTTHCAGWVLTQLSIKHGFHVYITMGNKFKEPNFLRVFKNLRKKFGEFGLLAVACIPELALGRTYIMEMGIPSLAVPLFFSGCAKWHGSKAEQTSFPFKHVFDLLNIE
ncbi:MAG: DUF116 domain-containing protein [Candidatus Hodarchaeales archaeon]|jgi:hypothetical protein